jgi:hypothetical protein
VSVTASPGNVEAGKPVFISGGVSEGTNFRCGDTFGYTISFGDGTRQSGTSGGCGSNLFANHVISTPGTYTATLTVRYSCIALSDWIVGTWSGARTASSTFVVREPGTAPPAAPNTAPEEDWTRERGSCATNPMWGLDYAFVGAALWLGAQAGRALRRRR